MSQTEAMKLALEALDGLYLPGELERVNKAITALQQALAEQPAQQEPVAWMRPDKGHIDFYKHPHYLPLYTTPQAQPARQPLTDELSTLKAVSDEYNAWIRYHAGGGSYDEFLVNKVAAHGITKGNT